MTAVTVVWSGYDSGSRREQVLEKIVNRLCKVSKRMSARTLSILTQHLPVTIDSNGDSNQASENLSHTFSWENFIHRLVNLVRDLPS
jgi:hypothetical protein